MSDWQQLLGRAPLTERQEEIREGFRRRRGYWADDWQLILELDPEFMAAYTDLSAYAWEHGGLDARTRELVYVATGAQVTHQHPIGILTHGRNALRAGATPEELLAVMELVSTLGVGSVELAVAELDGAIAEWRTSGGDAASAVAERGRAAFGGWDARLDAAAEAVPEFMAAMVEVAAVPRAAGVLSPKEVALISFAVDAMVTRLDEHALRRDLQAAKAAGVTPAELLDVCLQISGVSIHAVTVGVPILAELLLEREAAAGPGAS